MQLQGLTEDEQNCIIMSLEFNLKNYKEYIELHKDDEEDEGIQNNVDFLEVLIKKLKTPSKILTPNQLAAFRRPLKR